jgi:hypothetical protein
VASRGPDRWSSVVGLSREKCLTTAIDTDRCDDPSLSEAIQEAAQAEARAQSARARAERLGRDAESASSGQLDTIEKADTEDIDRATVEDNVLAVQHN